MQQVIRKRSGIEALDEHGIEFERIYTEKGSMAYHSQNH